jgi:hypothetical protein
MPMTLGTIGPRLTAAQARRLRLARTAPSPVQQFRPQLTMFSPTQEADRAAALYGAGGLLGASAAVGAGGGGAGPASFGRLALQSQKYSPAGHFARRLAEERAAAQGGDQEATARQAFLGIRSTAQDYLNRLYQNRGIGGTKRAIEFYQKWLRLAEAAGLTEEERTLKRPW